MTGVQTCALPISNTGSSRMAGFSATGGGAALRGSGGGAAGAGRSGFTRAGFGLAAGAGAGSGAAAGCSLSSEMMRRMEERISSIVGSCCASASSASGQPLKAQRKPLDAPHVPGVQTDRTSEGFNLPPQAFVVAARADDKIDRKVCGEPTVFRDQTRSTFGRKGY